MASAAVGEPSDVAVQEDLQDLGVALSPCLSWRSSRTQRVGGHVGVEQGAVPVVSFAAVDHQPIAHRGQRLAGPREKLREQDLRANVALLGVGALAPRNHLGPGELVVEEVTLVLVGVGDDRRVSG